ncbi:hypothetical protein KIF24_15570 [Micromonospora sp. Llam7]|uniref:NUDIX-like domain-containing protein n=1 Tax=Micromonospora tarapacensis TaxID=2835305 RepID=UPI001C83780E|nr:NUDIX-like domain-containing protein [Micromonospora tarapacensis]MBX7267298.1 hypothetical protein [Micromonospora tarapacensis]
MTFGGLAYTGTPQDRAASLRTDPDWVADRLRRDDSQVLPMWRDRPLLTATGHPVTLTGPPGRTLVASAGQSTLLGLDGTTAIFAADLSEVDEAEALRLGAAHASADLRSLAATLPAPLAATLAYARGLLYWNRHTRYCGTCGGSPKPRSSNASSTAPVRVPSTRSVDGCCAPGSACRRPDRPPASRRRVRSAKWRQPALSG